MRHVFCSFLILSITQLTYAQYQPSYAEIKKQMMAATKYMVEEVSTNGGYVSLYYPDLSRRWGELEAYKTMIWVEGGYGTVAMANCFLDLYEVIGDEYYYQAAEKAVQALIWGQHESGGWHYFIDFAGDRSMKEWYRTIGKNAWGFEEHNHYYGNATFDGKNTVSAAQLLLRIYLTKSDLSFKPALNRAINFILESQYPLGGWPQRYPLNYDFPHGELEDYTHFYTFNDDVISENLNFLIQCYVALGESRFLEPIQRAMNFYLITQQANPQAGWSKQHDLALRPAHARTYEPSAIYPDFTYTNAMLLLRFYELTGDRKYLARVPDAIDFLKGLARVNEAGEVSYPIFIELETNKPLYVHRKGSNVSNGSYWWDYDPSNVIQHYKGRKIDLKRLETEYQRLNLLTPAEAALNSPLANNNGKSGYIRDFLKKSIQEDKTHVSDADIQKAIASLDNRGRWLVKHQPYSLPYQVYPSGEVTNTARRSDAQGTTIVDPSDQLYISTQAYVSNMQLFMNYIVQHCNNK